MIWEVEFNSEAVSELENEMSRGYIITLAEESDDGKELVRFEKKLVDEIGKLKINMYANEHPPPHFHASYDREENSFRIDDCSPLYPNGGLTKWFKTIKKWHKDHKAELIATWNKMRPSDCPLGPIA